MTLFEESSFRIIPMLLQKCFILKVISVPYQEVKCIILPPIGKIVGFCLWSLLSL